MSPPRRVCCPVAPARRPEHQTESDPSPGSGPALAAKAGPRAEGPRAQGPCEGDALDHGTDREESFPRVRRRRLSLRGERTVHHLRTKLPGSLAVRPPTRTPRRSGYTPAGCPRSAPHQPRAWAVLPASFSGARGDSTGAPRWPLVAAPSRPPAPPRTHHWALQVLGAPSPPPGLQGLLPVPGAHCPRLLLSPLSGRPTPMWPLQP